MGTVILEDAQLATGARYPAAIEVQYQRKASLSRSGVCVNSNAKIAKGADEGGYEADCAWLLPHTRPMRYQPNQPFIYESNKHY